MHNRIKLHNINKIIVIKSKTHNTEHLVNLKMGNHFCGNTFGP